MQNTTSLNNICIQRVTVEIFAIAAYVYDLRRPNMLRRQWVGSVTRCLCTIAGSSFLFLILLSLVGAIFRRSSRSFQVFPPASYYAFSVEYPFSGEPSLWAL